MTADCKIIKLKSQIDNRFIYGLQYLFILHEN